MNMLPPSFPIDSSAILFLSQIAPDHTNVYRFTTEMSEPVDPEALQQAADQVYRRFPTIFAGFVPDSRFYNVVPAQQAPQVRKDPGLLKIMTPEELRTCGYRIFYSGCQIIIELFHSLTDGYGAIASLKALLAEYAYLRYGTDSPERERLPEEPSLREEEVRDSYLDHCGTKPKSLAHGYAYQLIRRDASSQVRMSMQTVSTQALRDAAKRHGVSVTSMLSELMAEAIMEHQNRHSGKSRKLPVRIMVPVDLRRHFPSKTLRNFVLYALATLNAEELTRPRKERFIHFQNQITAQTNKELLQAQISRNVLIQNNFLFKGMPLTWKCAMTRLSNRIFGETNSSITLTNLGQLRLSDGLQKYISAIHVYVMPRRRSPYNCGLLSCGDHTYITITRFDRIDELEGLFFDLLHEVLEPEAT